MIDKNELLSKLEDKYGELTNSRGCYIDNEWLSVSDIVDIIEECQDIE